MGYHRAGFEVVGVDIEPQPNYPFEFHQADALEYLRDHGHKFDAIHASPPCQGYSISRNNGCHADAPRLIGVTRDALRKIGKPFVIENVGGAVSALESPATLCGASFGLGASGMDLPRHRLFETNWFLLVPECQHTRGNTMGVYGHGTNSWHRDKLGRCLRVAEMREAMGIDWTTRAELSQAIPPAYTEYIGRELMKVLARN
jgi:DNA (cytosine-5)-methyltransferase 1